MPRYEKIRDELAAMKPYLETEYHVRELGLFETTCKTWNTEREFSTGQPYKDALKKT